MKKTLSSKRLKLNEWLTLSEAAKDLSINWDEAVTEADILKFALDGRLKLSVEFVNGIKAVPVNKINKKGFLLAADTGEVVMDLSGVWDLSMLGTGQLNIERLYRRMKGISQSDHSGIRGYLGIFVTGRGGEIYQLVKQLNPKECAARGHKAVPESPYITESGTADQAKIKAAIDQLNETWKRFCQDNAAVTLDDPTYYARLLQLPLDSTLVVRSEALREFEQSLADNDPKSDESTSINTPTIKRHNGYIDCIAQVIVEFTQDNGYAPESFDEVINRMKKKPPSDFIVDFREDGTVSIEGATSRRLSDLQRTIKKLLSQQSKQN